MGIDITTVGLVREQFRRYGHVTLSMDKMEALLDAAEAGLERRGDGGLVVVAKADRPSTRLVRLAAEHGRR
jgi:hypothetical protein